MDKESVSTQGMGSNVDTNAVYSDVDEAFEASSIDVLISRSCRQFDPSCRGYRGAIKPHGIYT